jgi:hypothetical protein
MGVGVKLCWAAAGATACGYGPYGGLTTPPGTKTVLSPCPAFPNGLGQVHHDQYDAECDPHCRAHRAPD